ncbi:DUF222 domain-containing protein, partial [Nakamurella sp. GG22]
MTRSVVSKQVSKGHVAGDVAAGIIDELAEQLKILGRAQARHAALMVDFTDTRRALDQHGINNDRHHGGQPSFKAGEFASTEISMAVKASKFTVQGTVSMARRVKAEAPDAWDAWAAGDIDQDKIIRINRALRRLVRNSSKELLNSVVVDLAVCRTPEILGRCLNQFILRIEPDLQDERLHRSLGDRYVSVRPDLDGISYLSAALSSIDAHAIDQVLRALAAIADPGDPRTLQQRRADALVDLLLGRISNGCHVVWDTNSDADDHLDDDTPDPTGNEDSGAGAGEDKGDDGADDGGGDGSGNGDDGSGSGSGDDKLGVADEWELPASAFRPDPPRSAVDTTDHTTGTPRVITCTGNREPRPVQVTIGVVVSVQSLIGATNTPGQLMDRSASVPADTLRALAQQPGSLFYRLLTDPHGNLLDVTELGRFPSGKLGTAIRFRDGVCANPTCTCPPPAATWTTSSPSPKDPPPPPISPPNAATNTAPKPTPDTTANAPAPTPPNGPP